MNGTTPTYFLREDRVKFLVAPAYRALPAGAEHIPHLTTTAEYRSEGQTYLATHLAFNVDGEVVRQTVISNQGRCAPLMTPEVAVRLDFTPRELEQLKLILNYELEDGVTTKQRDLWPLSYFVGFPRFQMQRCLRQAARESYCVFNGRSWLMTPFGQTVEGKMKDGREGIDPYALVDRRMIAEGILVVEDKGDQEPGRGYLTTELEHDPDTLSMRKQILLHMLGFSHFPRDQGVIGFIGRVPCPLYDGLPRFQKRNLMSGNYVRWHNATVQQMDLMIQGMLAASELLQKIRADRYKRAKEARDAALQRAVDDYTEALGGSLTSHGELRRNHGSLGNLHQRLLEDMRHYMKTMKANFIEETLHYANDCFTHRLMMAQRLMWLKAVRAWLVLQDPNCSPEDARPTFE